MLRRRRQNLFESPKNYKWRKVRFQNFNSHLKRVEKHLKKYYKGCSQFCDEEKSFGKVFKQRSSSMYDPTFEGIDSESKTLLEEEWNSLDKEKRDKYNRIGDLYNFVGNAFNKISSERMDLKTNIEEHLHRCCSDILVDQKVGSKGNKKYEESLVFIQGQKQKIESLKKSLSKTEKKSMKTVKIKEKEKSKKREDDIIAKIAEKQEEFEELKKNTALGEQQALDELDYQLEKADNDYTQYLRDIMMDYKNYFENGLKIMKKVCKDLDESNKGFKPAKRKEKTVVEITRNVFQPRRPTTIFGVEIPVVMKRREETGKLPKIVETMFEFLSRNKEEEGIFRKVGRKEDVDYLIRYIDNGQVNNFDDIENIHTIGSLLKQYIRSLPGSICDFNKFSPCLVEEDKEKQIQTTIELISELPQENRYLLYKLLGLMSECCKYTHVNKMNEKSMALVWSMNIIKPFNQDPVALMKVNPLLNDYVTVMLQNFKILFPKEPFVEYEKETDEDDEDDDVEQSPSIPPPDVNVNRPKIQNTYSPQVPKMKPKFAIDKKDYKQNITPIKARRKSQPQDMDKRPIGNSPLMRKSKAPAPPPNKPNAGVMRISSDPQIHEKMRKSPQPPRSSPPPSFGGESKNIRNIANAKRIARGMGGRGRGIGLREKKPPPRRPLPHMK